MKATILLPLMMLGFFTGVSAVAAPNQYQIEVSGGYAYLESDQSNFNARAQMYFAPVLTAKHVLAEAAFLERVSNIKISYGKPSYLYDGEDLFRGEEVVDFVYTQLSAEWYGSTTGLYLAFSQETYAVEEEFDYPDHDNWGGRIGFLPMQGILVYTSYDEEDGYNPNFSVKYVSSVNNGKAVNLEANYIDYGSDERNYLKVGADVYFSRFMSVGGTISQQDDTIFGFRMRYFFNPSYHVGASAKTGENVDEFAISMGIRF